VKQTLLEEDVLQTDRERVQALLHNDDSALDRIYADELIFTNQYGVVRDKAHWIATARAGEFKFDSYTTEDVRVRIYGETAVVTGRFLATGEARGSKLRGLPARYLCVYVKRDGRLQLVAQQATPIAAT
jgi:ketosteroid isomerase-like protein